MRKHPDAIEDGLVCPQSICRLTAMTQLCNCFTTFSGNAAPLACQPTCGSAPTRSRVGLPDLGVGDCGVWLSGSMHSEGSTAVIACSCTKTCAARASSSRQTAMQSLAGGHEHTEVLALLTVGACSLSASLGLSRYQREARTSRASAKSWLAELNLGRSSLLWSWTGPAAHAMCALVQANVFWLASTRSLDQVGYWWT
jgi:hypothetical protein